MTSQSGKYSARATKFTFYLSPETGNGLVTFVMNIILSILMDKKGSIVIVSKSITHAFNFSAPIGLV